MSVSLLTENLKPSLAEDELTSFIKKVAKSKLPKECRNIEFYKYCTEPNLFHIKIKGSQGRGCDVNLNRGVLAFLSSTGTETQRPEKDFVAITTFPGSNRELVLLQNIIIFELAKKYNGQVLFEGESNFDWAEFNHRTKKWHFYAGNGMEMIKNDYDDYFYYILSALKETEQYFEELQKKYPGKFSIPS